MRIKIVHWVARIFGVEIDGGRTPVDPGKIALSCPKPRSLV